VPTVSIFKLARLRRSGSDLDAPRGLLLACAISVLVWICLLVALALLLR
jgi:hypothetical protein